MRRRHEASPKEGIERRELWKLEKQLKIVQAQKRELKDDDSLQGRLCHILQAQKRELKVIKFTVIYLKLLGKPKRGN